MHVKALTTPSINLQTVLSQNRTMPLKCSALRCFFAASATGDAANKTFVSGCHRYL